MVVDEVALLWFAGTLVLGIAVAGLCSRSAHPQLLTFSAAGIAGALAAGVVLVWLVPLDLRPILREPISLIPLAFMFGPYCSLVGMVTAFFGCSFQWIFQWLSRSHNSQ